MRIVTISGKKRSGKDTTADIICEHRNAIKYALAYPIKEALDISYEKLALFEKSGVKLTFADFNGETDFDRESPLLLSNDDVHNLIIKSLEFLVKTYNLHIPTRDVSHIDNAISTLIMGNRKSWSIRRLMQTLGTDVVVSLIDREFWSRCMMQAYFDQLVKGKDVFIITDIRHPHEANLVRNLGAIILHIERDTLNTDQDEHVSEAGINKLPHEPVIKNNGTIEDLTKAVLAHI